MIIFPINSKNISCYGRLCQLNEWVTRQVLDHWFCIFNVRFLMLLKINLGFYSCPIRILSCSKNIIWDPWHIINVFVQGVFFPSKLKKEAKVIPVYKNDDESDPGNYRPMSLLSIFTRMYHRLIRAFSHGQKL